MLDSCRVRLKRRRGRADRPGAKACRQWCRVARTGSCSIAEGIRVGCEVAGLGAEPRWSVRDGAGVPRHLRRVASEWSRVECESRGSNSESLALAFDTGALAHEPAALVREPRWLMRDVGALAPDVRGLARDEAKLVTLSLLPLAGEGAGGG